MNDLPTNDAESAATNNSTSEAGAKAGEPNAELTTRGDWLLSAGMFNDFPASRQNLSSSWKGPRLLHCRRSPVGR